MTIVRYDPFRTLSQLQEEMNKLFEGRLGRADVDTNSNVATSDWIPAVDIKEEADRFVILADIPGVERKDIEITMENGVLSIKGERGTEKKEEREAYKRIERTHGSFYRRFGLPDTANAERISASTKNGVLEIVIPKQERLQPRKIMVE
jgi:HSP20 family protein